MLFSRSREANVYRLAEVSANIIDQCVAQGVPFAREYGGTLDNRSFGGVQVSRTFYARGQTGQQLLLGAYSALSRQIFKGNVKMYNRHEMVEIVKIDQECDLIIGDVIIEVNREKIKNTVHFLDIVNKIHDTGRSSLLLKVKRKENTFWATIKFVE